MASTTKIMTAIVALESLAPKTKVTISGNAAATTGSRLWLEKGEVLTVEQLMYGLLVSSANDAAVALAEASAGSTRAFVEKMNAKAKALGLSNTHYVNVNGLNAEKHFSSAKDLAILAQHAMLDPVFRRIVRTREYTLPDPANPEISLKHENHNLLLGWQAWVTGVKTGSTPYAKYCLVASGTRDGVSLVSVLLGAAEDDVRWKESKALLKYGFSLYARTVLADKGEMVTELAVPDGLDRRVRLVADRSLVVSLFKTDVVESSVRVDRDVILPVQAGDVFGTMEFTLDGKSLGSVSLIAAQPVENVTIKMILDHWRDRWLPNLALGDLSASNVFALKGQPTRPRLATSPHGYTNRHHISGSWRREAWDSSIPSRARARRPELPPRTRLRAEAQVSAGSDEEIAVGSLLGATGGRLPGLLDRLGAMGLRG